MYVKRKNLWIGKFKQVDNENSNLKSDTLAAEGSKKTSFNV